MQRVLRSFGPRTETWLAKETPRKMRGESELPRGCAGLDCSKNGDDTDNDEQAKPYSKANLLAMFVHTAHD